MTAGERLTQLPIEVFTSTLSPQDLPENSNCEFCESHLRREEDHWESTGLRNMVTVKAEKVPTLVCESEECGAGWYTDEVCLDLFSQAAPIFRKIGDFESAELFETQARDLSERIRAKNLPANQ